MDDEIERLVIGVRADTAGFARDVATMRASLASPLERDADRAGRAIETALARAVRTGKLGFDDLKRSALAVLGEIAAAAVSGGIASVLGGGGSKGGGGLASVAATLVGAVAGLPGRATGGPVSPGAAYIVGERGPELFVPTSSGQVRAAAVAAPAAVRETRAVALAPRETAREARVVAAAPRESVREVREVALAPPDAVREVREVALAPPDAVREVREVMVAPREAPREVRVAISVNVAAGAAPEALARSSRQVARAVRTALAAAER